MWDAFLREQGVRILTEASLPIISCSPAVHSVIQGDSERMLATSSHHSHEPVLEVGHLLRCWYFLHVCVSTLSPILMCASSPGPDLAIRLKCYGVEVTT